jgi:hypothetical protein
MEDKFSSRRDTNQCELPQPHAIMSTFPTAAIIQCSFYDCPNARIHRSFSFGCPVVISCHCIDLMMHLTTTKNVRRSPNRGHSTSESSFVRKDRSSTGSRPVTPIRKIQNKTNHVGVHTVIFPAGEMVNRRLLHLSTIGNHNNTKKSSSIDHPTHP